MAVHFAEILLVSPPGDLLTAGEREDEEHGGVETGRGAGDDDDPAGRPALPAREEDEGGHAREQLEEAESQKGEDTEDRVSLEVEEDVPHGFLLPRSTFCKVLCITK